MNLTNPFKNKYSIVNDFKYHFLLLQDLMGKFDHDFSSKLEYFGRIWNLEPDQPKNQSFITVLLEKEIKRSKDAYAILLKEKRFRLWTTIFLLCGILAMIVLFIEISISFYDLLHSFHYIVFLCIGISFIFLFIGMFLWHNYRSNTSVKREATLLRYQSFLNDLLKNRHDANMFVSQMLKAQEISMIKIDLTPAQLVSFLNALLKNIVVSTPFSNKELTQFFEDKCLQTNGKPFKNLQSLLSKYKNEDRDANHALSQFINKLSR